MRTGIIITAAWMLINGALFAASSSLGERWTPLTAGALQQILGGDHCTYSTFPDCPGHPENCDGDSDNTPADLLVECELVNGSRKCKNGGEEQYKPFSYAHTYEKCWAGGDSGGMSCTAEVDFECYYTWTCPTDCEVATFENPFDGIPWAGWRCKDGTDVEVGNYQPGKQVIGAGTCSHGS